MNAIFLALLNIFGPIVTKIITDHQARTGRLPTNEEMLAEFEANSDAILAEGAAWLATHPKP
jgi:hypothetical protein